MTTLKNNQNEQLFTNLTLEEAEVIQGGAMIHFRNVYARSLTRDDRDPRHGPRADEPMLYIRGKKIWGWKALYPGSRGRHIGRHHAISSYKDIEFREYDRGNANDRIKYAGVIPTVGPKGSRSSLLRFRGNGAEYQLRISWA